MSLSSPSALCLPNPPPQVLSLLPKSLPVLRPPPQAESPLLERQLTALHLTLPMHILPQAPTLRPRDLTHHLSSGLA